MIFCENFVKQELLDSLENGKVRAVEGSKVVGGTASRGRSGTLADQTKAWQEGLTVWEMVLVILWILLTWGP